MPNRSIPRRRGALDYRAREFGAPHEPDVAWLYDQADEIWGASYVCTRPFPPSANRTTRGLGLSDDEWALLRLRAQMMGWSAAHLVRVMCGLWPAGDRPHECGCGVCGMCSECGAYPCRCRAG